MFWLLQEIDLGVPVNIENGPDYEVSSECFPLSKLKYKNYCEEIS